MSSSEETGTKLYRGEVMKSKAIEGKLSLTNGKEEKSIPAEAAVAIHVKEGLTHWAEVNCKGENVWDMSLLAHLSKERPGSVEHEDRNTAISGT